MAVPMSNLFDKLPVEINQHIALQLDSPRDICSLARACGSTHAAIEGNGWSFWRRHFLDTFEKPTWKQVGNAEYKEAYKKRKIALMYGADFKKDTRGTEARHCLEVLRDLIIDSFSEMKSDQDPATYVSKNMQYIEQFLTNHDILRYVLKPRKRSGGRRKDCNELDPLLCTIQCVLAPRLLSLDYYQDHFNFPSSQAIVYGTAADHPIFNGCNGLDVNMGWLLHQVNFWKYHMLREAECSLFKAYSDLEPDERPRYWTEQLKQGYNKLGRHWKGSYAYVDQSVIKSVRRGDGQDSPIADEFNGEIDTGSFQDMRLDFVDEKDAPWPPAFERHLRALTPPVNRAKTRAQHRSATPDSLANFKPISFQFEGEGHDAAEDFLAQGWLNPLPPQHGIPGWQRMTMMKYFTDPFTGAIDHDALWAYEGVVLPGGQVMLGRWWSPTNGTGEDMYSGPFILWCVDGPAYASDEEDEEDGEADVGSV